MLSHSAVYKEMEKEIVKKSKKKAAKKEVSTLGDIDALANLKKKMNKEENED